MHRWRSVVPLLLIVALAACGQSDQAAAPSAANVPTSDTTALESTLPSAAPSEADTDVTEVANEEVTVSPETIDVGPSSEANTAGTATAAGGTSTGEFNCRDQAQLDGELNIFTWADYWPEESENDVIGDFEAACGVEVTLTTYASNEEMAAKLRAGNSGYDIIVPSDYMVATLAAENRLLPLDKAQLPNMANLDPDQMGLYYDPPNEYSIPFQYGMTGIGYNAAQVDPAPDSWAVLFEPDQFEQYNGQFSMLDDERETIGAALKYRGYSVNSTNPDELAEAQALLEAQKCAISSYDSESYTQALAAEEILMAHAWNGNTSLAKSENENIEWIVPQEGGVIWQDNLAIPADAPHPYTAHVFINNVLDGEIGARITNYTYYLTPNAAAEPLLDEEVQAIQFLPTDELRERLEYIERTGDPRLYSDIWTQIQAKQC
jgi:spermidine/putrescine transport system substrate-binding protein